MTDIKKQLAKWIDDDRDKIIEFLCDFVRAKSPNPPATRPSRGPRHAISRSERTALSRDRRALSGSDVRGDQLQRASVCDPNHEMMGILRAHAKALGRPDPTPIVSQGGTDARLWRQRGIPRSCTGRFRATWRRPMNTWRSRSSFTWCACTCSRRSAICRAEHRLR